MHGIWLVAELYSYLLVSLNILRIFWYNRYCGSLGTYLTQYIHLYNILLMITLLNVYSPMGLIGVHCIWQGFLYQFNVTSALLCYFL